MTDIAKRIRSKIETFTSEIAALVREDALRQVTEAIGAARGTATARRKDTVAKVTRSKKPRGEKRTASDLAVTADHVLQWIRGNPGQGVEHIAKGIAIDSRDLKLPIKKLLADGVIKTKGQRRGTKYTAK